MQHFSRKALPLFPHSPATLLLNSPADPANPIPMTPQPLPPAGDIASPAAEDGLPVEAHPLPPFLPEGARILFLGSFPPPRKRWCMDFFYPNWTNDFWRIWGFLAAGDKDYFTVPGQKRFDRARIEQFCRQQGLALYDTAEAVVRLKNNASDNFLRIVRPTDLASLLRRLPLCHTLVATGQKSAETLGESLGFEAPGVGGRCEISFIGRPFTVWRMPSSSRAYPRPVEWKAEFYRKILE